MLQNPDNAFYFHLDETVISKHLDSATQIAIEKLHKKSLILLDDKGSKTNLSINFLTKNNFKIIYMTC